MGKHSQLLQVARCTGQLRNHVISFGEGGAGGHTSAIEGSSLVHLNGLELGLQRFEFTLVLRLILFEAHFCMIHTRPMRQALIHTYDFLVGVSHQIKVSVLISGLLREARLQL